MEASATVTTKDGSTFVMRLADADDRETLISGFARLSPESRFYRFFTGMPELTDQMVKRLTDVDQVHHVAVGVFDPSRPSDIGRPEGLGVGVGRYILSNKNPEQADFALAIVDEYQGRGVGTVLLEALVQIAHAHGVQTFTADVLADNRGMIGILERLGASRTSPGDSASERSYEMNIAETAASLEGTINHGELAVLARPIA